MFDFFNTIVGYIETIWNFFWGLVQSLLMAIKFLITGTDAVLYLVGFLPAVIGGAVVVFFFIYVLKFLIGR